LDHFRLIVPCGLDKPVTSISAQLGRPVATAEVAAPLAECLAEALGMELTRGATGCLSARAKPTDTGCKQPVAPGAAKPQTPRLPEWLRKPIPPAGVSKKVRDLLRRHRLSTVCQGARCPNRPECFGRGTAAFMILGDHCTRNCRFCAVEPGQPGPPRPDEPEAVARAAAEMGLTHVVITSVTRDDLPDGGSAQFARTVRQVRRLLPEATVEVLTPDFQGDPAAVERVCGAGPDVFNHNVETVPRLYAEVRPQARYRRSLEVLAWAKRLARDEGWPLLTKSGLMVGLGETDDEVARVMTDLRHVGCDLLTIGQYLQPTPRHLPVRRFVPPGQFDAWRDHALKLGFAAVAAAPHVRSSYHAESILPGRRG
ncbi:MAG TPA: lipoyl synthase, partial [Phycisphaerae bacterium]|nr:lipoyl synthase [Phycisphaerae bacterium]